MARYRYNVATEENDHLNPFPNPVSIPTISTGMVFHVLGWEEIPDEHTEWTGFYANTGKLVVCPLGDDSHYLCEPEDIIHIEREAYCGECGQMGCGYDGIERGNS